MFVNFSYRLLQNIVFIIISIIVMPIFYEALGPYKLGVVSYVDSIATYFSIFAGFGIARYGTREINKLRDDIEHNTLVVNEMRNINLLMHIIANVLYIVFFFISGFQDDNLFRLLFVISFLSVNRNFFNIDWYYEAHEKFKLLSIKNAVIKIVLISILYVIYLSNKELVYFYYGLTAGFTLISFLSSYIFFRCTDTVRIKEKLILNSNTINRLLTLTPTVLLSNSYLLYLQLDKVFLGRSNPLEAGYYSISERVAILIFQFMMTIIVVTIPRISKLYNTNIQNYFKETNNLIRMVLLITAPISVGLMVISSNVILYFGGVDFQNAIPVIQVFSLLILILGVWRIVANHVLFVSGNEKMSFYIILIGGLINLLIKLFIKDITAVQSITITTFIHMITLFAMILFYKMKLQFKIRIFTFDNIKYIITAFLFIPIKLGVDYFFDSNIVVLMLTIGICASVYLGVLYYLLKDKLVRDVVENKIIRKRL